jgi:hypothetical protein
MLGQTTRKIGRWCGCRCSVGLRRCGRRRRCRRRGVVVALLLCYDRRLVAALDTPPSCRTFSMHAMLALLVVIALWQHPVPMTLLLCAVCPVGCNFSDSRRLGLTSLVYKVHFLSRSGCSGCSELVGRRSGAETCNACIRAYVSSVRTWMDGQWPCRHDVVMFPRSDPKDGPVLVRHVVLL